jgi:hypothetical protein
MRSYYAPPGEFGSSADQVGFNLVEDKNPDQNGAPLNDRGRLTSDFILNSIEAEAKTIGPLMRTTRATETPGLLRWSYLLTMEVDSAFVATLTFLILRQVERSYARRSRRRYLRGLPDPGPVVYMLLERIEREHPSFFRAREIDKVVKQASKLLTSIENGYREPAEDGRYAALQEMLQDCGERWKLSKDAYEELR